MSDQRDLSNPSETSEERSKRMGRRALMLGAAGAGAAASLIAQTEQADAATGGDVILGSASNQATGTTEVTSSSGTGFRGNASTVGQSGVAGIDTSGGVGHGTYGRSTNGVGVYGVLESGPSGMLSGYTPAPVVGDSATYPGVIGLSLDNYGVWGVSEFNNGVAGETSHPGSSGVWGNDASVDGSIGVLGVSSNGTGVQGANEKDGTCGVKGIDQSASGGFGVYGESSTGVGVFASNPAGTALQVNGGLELSKSGAATVAAGKSSVKVTGVTLGSASLTFATIQGHVTGLGVEGVVSDPSASELVIYLTKVVTAAVTVAWFVIG